MLTNSTLGLELEDGLLRSGLKVEDAQISSQDTTWRPVLGEQARIRDHYQQLVLHLREAAKPFRRLQVTFRAYDEGLAFNYTLPSQVNMADAKIVREQSEFRFPVDAKAWVGYSAQCTYEEQHLSRLRPGCERPLIVSLQTNLCVALAEARLVDYARMKFAPLPGTPGGLVSHLDGPVRSPLPCTSPWRVIMVASQPGRLVENNHLLASLNDPCALADTSWIRPGTVLREVSLTTDGGKACVDLAARQGLNYILFDAGWYGHEYDREADAREVNLDPKRSKGPLDLQEVIRYAAEKHIGVILYVNHLALEKQLDDLLPLYQSWGVKGVKFGFVNVGSQEWTRFLHDAIRQAARYHLMVDVHDEYRPTGFNRTYPNLMTTEGILGDEATPPLRQTLVHAFARMIAGPADNTVCYFSPRVDTHWTHAAQLAKPIVLFSPWQFLFWYDRPAAIEPSPELELWRNLPTVWDETRIPAGEIGKYIVVARRSGPRWFLGFLNADEPRSLDLPLNFLPAGPPWQAEVYTHAPELSTRTKVSLATRPVVPGAIFKLAAPANSGMAVRFTPPAAAGR